MLQVMNNKTGKNVPEGSGTLYVDKISFHDRRIATETEEKFSHHYGKCFPWIQIFVLAI